MLRDTQLQKIFLVIKDIIHKMGQVCLETQIALVIVCLETQIALAIQFLLTADQEVGDYLEV